MEDYYKILEVSKTASTEEIRKSYKRLAKLYHPDTHPGDTVSANKFKDVNEAHSVLSDAGKRREYDAALLNPDKQGGNRVAPDKSAVNDILNVFDNFKF